MRRSTRLTAKSSVFADDISESTLADDDERDTLLNEIEKEVKVKSIPGSACKMGRTKSRPIEEQSSDHEKEVKVKSIPRSARKMGRTKSRPIEEQSSDHEKEVKVKSIPGSARKKLSARSLYTEDQSSDHEKEVKVKSIPRSARKKGNLGNRKSGIVNSSDPVLSFDPSDDNIPLTDNKTDDVNVEVKRKNKGISKRKTTPMKAPKTVKLTDHESSQDVHQNKVKKLTKFPTIEEVEPQNDFSDSMKTNSSQNVNVTSQEKKELENSDVPKSKVGIRIDLSKYANTDCGKPLNSLMKTSLALKNNFPFKEHLKKSNKGKSSSNAIDVFDLDNAHVTSENSTDDLPSTIQTDLDSNDLYFQTSSSGVSKVNSNDAIVSKLMKKSVLPDDLERLEKAPKLYVSPYQIQLERKQKSEETAGKGWFNLPKTEMTDEIKRDIQLIRMRNVLDAKRHYKRNDSNKLPTYFQVGTIVEGAHEYYSQRVPKSKRKRTVVDELMEDAELRRRNKKKMIEIKKKQMSGGKGFHKSMKNKKKPTWART